MYTINEATAALDRWSQAKDSDTRATAASYETLESHRKTLISELAAYDGTTESLEKLNNTTKQGKAHINALRQAARASGDDTKKLATRLQDLGKKFVSWFGVSQIIMYAIRSVRRMFTAAKELNTAMTQMQIVTKASGSEMERFGDKATQAAKRVSSSITDIINSATTYARLGYTMDESTQLAEYTSMLQKVGDIEVGDAQNAITSMLKAFDDVNANDIESTMDKLVETGNNFPISVSQIAEGMTNASSTLAASGNSFEQSVALLTAANTTIQNASKSSTGLRTIAARIRNTKTELDDLGETMTEANYEELVNSLTKAGVSLTDINGEYRSTYDIMADIASKWSDMSSMEQAAMATALSGTRQQAVFYSIIEQFQEASGAMEAMQDSAGALDSAFSAYSDSIEGKMGKLSASFQELSKDVISSDLVGNVVSAGNIILNIIDGLVKSIGTLNTALAGLAIGKTIKSFA